ncbi:MAG: LLM class flavin-dependent oxidoreductase [Acidimicrobiales bacterium]
MRKSGSSVRVGVSTPWDLARLPAGGKQQRLAAIADAGLDFVFTADHVSFHDGSGIDGLIHLAAMGGMEPRLDLYAGVLLLALRHPMVAARQIASLAEMAPGRLTVGVGVGGEDRHEFEVCGVDPATRGRRTDAALTAVRALLSGDTVDGDGDLFTFTGGRIRPTPDPPVPFVIGGRSDAALRRAGRLGDGWLATWCSVDRFRRGTDLVERLGADREVTWRHGIQTWVGVGADADEGRSHVAERMTAFYKIDFAAFARYTPVGTPGQIADFLGPYVDAGATTVSLTPCGAGGDAETEGMARVAELLR